MHPIQLEFGTFDYVREATPAVKFHGHSFKKASAQMGEIYANCFTYTFLEILLLARIFGGFLCVMAQTTRSHTRV